MESAEICGTIHLEINFSSKVYSKSLLKVWLLKGSIVYSLILDYQFCACVIRISGIPQLQAFFVLLAIGLQKPSRTSKSKDHQYCLKERLEQWKEVQIKKLLREGCLLQSRLSKAKSQSPQDKARIFANLIMDGQINSAVRFLTENGNNGILPLNTEVIQELKAKHPEAKDPSDEALLYGPIDDVPSVIFHQLNGEMIRSAALRTKGSGGPCRIDANGFRRILACKSFKQSSVKLCDEIAMLAARLCTTYIDPGSIEALLACRLIPLDKGDGSVRPIVVGEVIRRIIAKCVVQIAKPEIIQATGSMQVCAGQKSGSEAAIHAMSEIFHGEDTDAVLLIDASNAFNSLNRMTALHNILVTCPIIAPYAINTYRNPARLFVVEGDELLSAEGTTQGDPLSMAFYGISLVPLMSKLNEASNAVQCWLADDASCGGKVRDILKWWLFLKTVGPKFGYFPKATKCWLIVKPDKFEAAKSAFDGTDINVTCEGQRHLGAVLGSRSYLEEYVGNKVETWVQEILKLSEFAMSKPQAAYAAFSFGVRHKWTYFLRTIPDIEDLLQPLEEAIRSVLIPTLLNRTISYQDRRILELPVCLGGLGIVNPSTEAKSNYQYSKRITRPLTKHIIEQKHELPDEAETLKIKKQVEKDKLQKVEQQTKDVLQEASEKMQRAVELSQEKDHQVGYRLYHLKRWDLP